MSVGIFLCVSFYCCESQQIPTEGETRAPLSLLSSEGLTEPSQAEGLQRRGSRAGHEHGEEETSSGWSIKVKPSYDDLNLWYLTYVSEWNIIRLVSGLHAYIKRKPNGWKIGKRNANDSPLYIHWVISNLCVRPHLPIAIGNTLILLET